MEKAQAQSFLESLLNKKLRVHTTDERMFWGDFKCTDPVCILFNPYTPLIPLLFIWSTNSDISNFAQDRNIVLQYTYEYRQPSAAQRAKAAAESEAAGKTAVKMDLIHRYLGLVVVPGEHIVKIEKEDFASQMK